MKTIKNITLLGLTLLMMPVLTSCDDWFDIKPESEIVGDDFWQSESDVESAVSACYRALMEPEAMERIIVWSEMRSDNVLRGMNANTDMYYMLSANITASNGYTSWRSFYAVINYCNTVLENAPGVMNIDPDFKIGELRAYQAEVKTLRALCYFYLVRTFKDVPFVLESYSDDTRPFQIAKTDGDYILDTLLAELEEIAENHAKSIYSSTAFTRGRITQKAMWALMADMYLWRNNYTKCVEYCEKILNTTTNPLALEISANYNRNVFGLGNSTESIFELQFSSESPNYVVNEMYGESGGRWSANYLSSFDFKNYTSLFTTSDLRMKDAFWGEATTAMIPIKKYIAYRKDDTSNADSYVTNENTQNWIFYRLSDVYLMEAEALVERNEGNDLQKAIELVGKTYDRANPSLEVGTLKLEDYNSQSLMRDLVFDERQRELLFEGKRYYDILRRIRRSGDLQSIVSSYLLRKYVSFDQTTVMTKLNTLNALYLPINKSELDVNKLLEQNPFYVTTTNIEKN